MVWSIYFSTSHRPLHRYEFGTRFEAIVRLSGRVGVVVYAPSAVDKRLNELSGAASGIANELLLLNFDVC